MDNGYKEIMVRPDDHTVSQMTHWFSTESFHQGSMRKHRWALVRFRPTPLEWSGVDGMERNVMT